MTLTAGATEKESHRCGLRVSSDPAGRAGCPDLAAGRIVSKVLSDDRVRRTLRPVSQLERDSMPLIVDDFTRPKEDTTV